MERQCALHRRLRRSYFFSVAAPSAAFASCPGGIRLQAHSVTATCLAPLGNASHRGRFPETEVLPSAPHHTKTSIHTVQRKARHFDKLVFATCAIFGPNVLATHYVAVGQVPFALYSDP